MQVNISAPGALTHAPVNADAGRATGTLGARTVQSATPLPARATATATAPEKGFLANAKAFFSRLTAPSEQTLIKRSNQSVQKGLQAAGRQTGQLVNALKQPGVNAAAISKLVSGMPNAAGPAVQSGVPFAALIKDRADAQIKQITNLADLSALRNGLNQPPCNESHDPTVCALRNAVNDKLSLLRNLDFNQVLTSGDPLVKAAFRAHVSADFTGPNLDFLQEVAKFKSSPSLSAAQGLADRFFLGAEPPVDISDALTTELRTALTEIRQAQQPSATAAQKVAADERLLHIFDTSNARVSYEASAGSFTNFKGALSPSLPANLQTSAQSMVAANVAERSADAAVEKFPTEERGVRGLGSGADNVFWVDLNRANYSVKDASGSKASLLDRATYADSSGGDQTQQKLASIQRLQQLTGANPAMLMMVTKMANQSMLAGAILALATPTSPFRLPDGTAGMPVYPPNSEDISYTIAPGRLGAVVISAEITVDHGISNFINPTNGEMKALDPSGTSFKARIEVTVEANLQVRVSRPAEFECNVQFGA